MLAWEMGVGKTATLLRAWENSPEHGPALVLCLASARENWRREALRFAIDPDFPPRVQVLKNAADVIHPHADIVVTNYDKLLNPMVRKKLARNWGALILDEAHYLKSSTAQRTKYVYGQNRKRGSGQIPLSVPLINRAARVWPATGTPMPNNPAELWTHAFHLWPESIVYRDGKPMELWEFELGFCETRQGKYGVNITGGKNLAELRQRLDGKMHRLRRSEVLSLPPLRIDTWPLDNETTSGVGKVADLPDLLLTLSEKYGSPENIEHFDIHTIEAYLACIGSQFVALATVRRETSTLKAIYAGMLVKEELEQGAGKCVVFAHHREAIATLEKILRDHQPAIVHGGTDNRDEQIDRFQNDPACMVFIGQLQAAGTSINLQAAENVVFVEASWTPGDNDQAYSRVYRAGQTKPVLVRFLYLPGSIDEAVMRALARKSAMIAQVIH
jgi:SNF2 family DNA or RNA helicase